MITRPKSGKRKDIKPAGKCIFCGGGAVPGNPMSREHFWSNWMAPPLLPPIDGYVEFKSTLKQKSHVATSHFERERQGGPYTKKIKVVCEQCNTGWMEQRHEATARPYLTPLIQMMPIRLTQEVQFIIARWIVLKMLVVENDFLRG